MNKAPLLVVDGKIGRFGGAVNTKFEGVGALKKSGGLYMFQASLTATQAHKLEAMAKRVPVEREARTRARAGVHPYEGKDGEALLPRHQGSKVDPIKLTVADDEGETMTYAGHAYFQERQNNPAFTPDEQDLARRVVRQQGDRLTDPFRPKDPMVDGMKDGETHVAFAKRRLAHQKKTEKRAQILQEHAFDIREPEALDYERLVAMLRADPGKRAEIDRAIAKNGRWVWKFDNPILGYVEYIEFDSMYEVDQEMKDDLPVEDPDLLDIEAALMAPGPRPDPAVVADRLAGTTRRVRLRRPPRRLPGPPAPAPPTPRAPPAGLPPPASPASPPPPAPAADERNRQMLRAMLGAMDPASRAAALAGLGKGGGKGK